MHPVIRAVGVPIARLLDGVLRLSGRRVGVALIYHSVDPMQGNLDRELVAPHGAHLFEAQLTYLKAQYRVVRAENLLDAIAGRRRGQPFPAAVTFDDDLSSHARIALPILARTGVPATFFLSGASLASPFSFWWERLQAAMTSAPAEVAALSTGASAHGPRAIHELGRQVEQMTPEARDAFASMLAERFGPDPIDAGIRADDVKRLVDAGLAVGFHTLRHDPLPSLDDDALARAMTEGRARLEAVVGESLTLIAYPHGHADSRVAAAARAAGYRFGFTGRPEAVDPHSDPLLLGRISPSYQSTGHFALQLARRLMNRAER